MTDLLPIGFRALAHHDDISRLINLVQPLFQHVLRVYPEAAPIALKLIAEIIPESQHDIATKSALVVITTRWAQEHLNQLGEKLVVDGDYGPATQQAVKRFQLAHNLTVDGWFGEKTMTAMILELDRRKK